MTKALKLVGFLVLGFALLLGASYVYLDRQVTKLARALENPSAKSEFQLELASEIFDRKGRKIGEFAAGQRYYVSLDNLPEHVSQAFVAAEDANFYDHFGVDIVAILRAFWANVSHAQIVQGGSTITQQLARLQFLNSEKSLDRKLNELVFALALEKIFTKKEILEQYLNKVFFGNNSYGIEAASRNYFRKSSSQLNVAEAAMLAGLLKAPSMYAPHRFFRKAKKRQAYVLGRMREEGYLQPKNVKRWLRHKLTIAKQPLKNDETAPYFIAALRQELERMFEFGDLNTRGLKIYTTLDLNHQNSVQRQLSTLVRKRLGQRQDLASLLRAGLLAIDVKTGGVVSLQGGLDFASREFNHVAQAQRPLGSAFMPFYYALAIEKGFTLASSLFFEREFVRSVEGQTSASEGDLSLYSGLLSARTVESSRLATWLGIGTIADFAQKLGFSFERRDLSIVLGRQESDLMKLVSAFSIFANAGMQVEPYMIETIKNRNDEIIYERGSYHRERKISKQTAYILSQVLKDVLRFGIGQPATQAIRSDLAGMVGVDEARHDAWYIGFDHQFCVGLWIGVDKGQQTLAPSKAELAGVAGDIWAKLSEKLFDESHQRQQQVPDGISFARFKLSTSEGIRTIPFRTGTEPVGKM